MVRPKNRRELPAILIALLVISTTSAHGQEQVAASDIHAVAADVQFLVLGKMSLYNQDALGGLTLRDHHFVAEIMPRAGRKIVSGTLASAADPEQVLPFAAEGDPFLAHGARVMNPEKLHRLHPDGEYIFSYATESGRMESHPVTLTRRDAIDGMPEGAVVSLAQNGASVTEGEIDPDMDLLISWEQMAGNTRMPGSDLDDLVFVLGFDCFGNNVYHSGRPYQKGTYLTYKDTEAIVPASSLQPGMTYLFIVEQATADVTLFHGVAGIATYATLTFVNLQTTGQAIGEVCESPDSSI